MSSLGLDSNNDIIFEKGRFVRVIEGPAMVQKVRSRLLLYFNEWFLDITVGVPYFEEIFVKPANLPRTESILKRTILETPGVTALNSFELDFNTATRRLLVSFSATSIWGEISPTEVTING